MADFFISRLLKEQRPNYIAAFTCIVLYIDMDTALGPLVYKCL